MNWYKRSQKIPSDRWQYDENTMCDYYDEHDQYVLDQVYDFNDSQPGDRQPWRLIPAGRLKKIWRDTAKMGFVRDIKGIEMIERIIIENVRKVHANTILMGHTTHSPSEYLGDLTDNELTMNETDEHDYGDWASDDRGSWRISDYALGKLINGCMELMYAKTPEEKLTKIDWILNVIHMRSDIAGWFVEGGSQTLNELSA
jgi:hypothetical protein